MAPAVAFRLRLRALRKRKGAFRTQAAADAEIARLLAMLEPGTIERTVFELTEIAGLPYKAVAAELGMSERHLYRVRLSLFERLAATETQIDVAPIVAPEVTRIEFARSLLKYGHATRAEEVVGAVLARPLPAMQAVEALTVRAMALSDQERFSEAVSLLEEARTQAAGLDSPEARTASRAIDMAFAYIPYHDGWSDRAIELSEAALGKPADLQSAHEIRSFARDLIFLAVQHQESRSPERCLECLAKALEMLKRLPVPPAAEVAQVYIHSAFGRSALPQQSAQALSDAQEALRIAQWHGLRFEEIWANLAIAILHDMAGKPHEGLEPVRHAIELANDVLDGDPLIRTLFVTARIEGAAGLGNSALARLHSARPLTQHHGLLRGILEVAEARARRQRGEVDATIAASSRAIVALEGRGMTHYLGTPYLSRALATLKLGAKPVDDVERAIYYLENGGALSDKAAALELSHKLTRNKKDLQRARELKRAAEQIA